MMQNHQGIINSSASSSGSGSGGGSGSYIEKHDSRVELQHGDVSVLSPALLRSGKTAPALALAPSVENDIHRIHIAEGGILLSVEKLHF